MFPQSFNRPFQLWHYSVAHAQLLIRSVKSDTHATRVDVAFKDVRYIQLPANMDRLMISNGREIDLAVHIRRNVELSGAGIFLVTAGALEGLVVAGYGVWGEDSGEYHEPSTILDAGGRLLRK